MPDQCRNCNANPVDIARNTYGTPTAKLIAILEAHGITSAAELAEIVGISDRAIRKSRNYSSGTTVPTGTTGPEPQDRSGTTVPKTELQDRNSGSSPSCAHATKESPTEISSYLEVKEEIYMSEPSVSDPCVKDTPKAKRRFSYTHEFETFWKSYPDTTNNSKPEAFKQWRSLTSVEQHNAADGLRHLAAHCKANPTYRCVHACRYLSQRRWESYPTAADRLGANVVPISTYKPMPQPAQGMSREALEKWALELEANHG